MGRVINFIKKAKMGGRVNKNNASRKIKETASNAKIREKLIRYAFEQHEDAPADIDTAVKTLAKTYTLVNGERVNRFEQLILKNMDRIKRRIDKRRFIADVLAEDATIRKEMMDLYKESEKAREGEISKSNAGDFSAEINADLVRLNNILTNRVKEPSNFRDTITAVKKQAEDAKQLFSGEYVNMKKFEKVIDNLSTHTSKIRLLNKTDITEIADRREVSEVVNTVLEVRDRLNAIFERMRGIRSRVVLNPEISDGDIANQKLGEFSELVWGLQKNNKLTGALKNVGTSIVDLKQEYEKWNGINAYMRSGKNIKHLYDHVKPSLSQFRSWQSMADFYARQSAGDEQKNFHQLADIFRDMASNVSSIASIYGADVSELHTPASAIPLTIKIYGGTTDEREVPGNIYNVKDRLEAVKKAGINLAIFNNTNPGKFDLLLRIFENGKYHKKLPEIIQNLDDKALEKLEKVTQRMSRFDLLADIDPSKTEKAMDYILKMDGKFFGRFEKWILGLLGANYLPFDKFCEKTVDVTDGRVMDGLLSAPITSSIDYEKVLDMIGTKDEATLVLIPKFISDPTPLQTIKGLLDTVEKTGFKDRRTAAETLSDLSDVYGKGDITVNIGKIADALNKGLTLPLRIGARMFGKEVIDFVTDKKNSKKIISLTTEINKRGLNSIVYTCAVLAFLKKGMKKISKLEKLDPQKMLFLDVGDSKWIGEEFLKADNVEALAGKITGLNVFDLTNKTIKKMEEMTRYEMESLIKWIPEGKTKELFEKLLVEGGTVEALKEVVKQELAPELQNEIDGLQPYDLISIYSAEKIKTDKALEAIKARTEFDANCTTIKKLWKNNSDAKVALGKIINKLYGWTNDTNTLIDTFLKNKLRETCPLVQSDEPLESHKMLSVIVKTADKLIDTDNSTKWITLAGELENSYLPYFSKLAEANKVESIIKFKTDIKKTLDELKGEAKDRFVTSLLAMTINKKAIDTAKELANNKGIKDIYGWFGGIEVNADELASVRDLASIPEAAEVKRIIKEIDDLKDNTDTPIENELKIKMLPLYIAASKLNDKSPGMADINKELAKYISAGNLEEVLKYVGSLGAIVGAKITANETDFDLVNNYLRTIATAGEINKQTKSELFTLMDNPQEIEVENFVDANENALATSLLYMRAGIETVKKLEGNIDFKEYFEEYNKFYKLHNKAVDRLGENNLRYFNIWPLINERIPRKITAKLDEPGVDIKAKLKIVEDEINLLPFQRGSKAGELQTKLFNVAFNSSDINSKTEENPAAPETDVRIIARNISTLPNEFEFVYSRTTGKRKVKLTKAELGVLQNYELIAAETDLNSAELGRDNEILMFYQKMVAIHLRKLGWQFIDFNSNVEAEIRDFTNINQELVKYVGPEKMQELIFDNRWAELAVPEYRRAIKNVLTSGYDALWVFNSLVDSNTIQKEDFEVIAELLSKMGDSSEKRKLLEDSTTAIKQLEKYSGVGGTLQSFLDEVERNIPAIKRGGQEGEDAKLAILAQIQTYNDGLNPEVGAANKVITDDLIKIRDLKEKQNIETEFERKIASNKYIKPLIDATFTWIDTPPNVIERLREPKKFALKAYMLKGGLLDFFEKVNTQNPDITPGSAADIIFSGKVEIATGEMWTPTIRNGFKLLFGKELDINKVVKEVEKIAFSSLHSWSLGECTYMAIIEAVRRAFGDEMVNVFGESYEDISTKKGHEIVGAFANRLYTFILDNPDKEEKETQIARFVSSFISPGLTSSDDPVVRHDLEEIITKGEDVANKLAEYIRHNTLLMTPEPFMILLEVLQNIPNTIRPDKIGDDELQQIKEMTLKGPVLFTCETTTYLLQNIIGDYAIVYDPHEVDKTLVGDNYVGKLTGTDINGVVLDPSDEKFGFTLKIPLNEFKKLTNTMFVGIEKSSRE